MAQDKALMSSYTERVELGSAAKLIAESKQAPGNSAREAAMRVVEAECGQIARSVIQGIQSSLLAAEADAEVLRTRSADARASLLEAKQAETEGSRHGSWTKVVIWSLFALACFGAEFILTWTALCFVLNVQRMSVLGVLLGLAPPSGLAVLEIFLARLFEDPWQRMRKATATGKAWAMNTAMAVLLIALASGNVLMITHLAKAREEAAKLQRALGDVSAGEEPDVDQDAIDRAVLLVSILVSADGAVFLLLCLGEGSALALRARLKRRVNDTSKVCAELESAAAAAKAKTGTLREEAKTAPEKAALSAERYRAHCQFLLAEKSATDRERPLAELIDRALRLRIPA